MRITAAQHASQPWRISEITSDFELIDAWALPVSGRPDQFHALEDIFLHLDPSAGSRGVGLLFALRARLGQWLGWEAQANALPIPGCRETSLRERLPADLRDPAAAPDAARFRLVYRTATEWTRERSNATVHAVMHIGWVPLGDGSYRPQLGVYVKPRGRFGRLYMSAIAPFRHWIVYPTLLEQIGRSWNRHTGASQ